MVGSSVWNSGANSGPTLAPRELALVVTILDECLYRVNITWQYGTGGGIVGFIVLILDIIVWIEILKSNRPTSHKLLWCLLVFIFPIVGLIIYWLFSNRAAHNTRGDYEPI